MRRRWSGWWLAVLGAGLALVAALAGALALPGVAAAASSSGPGAAPGLLPVGVGSTGYYTYTLSPGQSTQGQIVVKNPSSSPQTFPMYPVDATTSPVTGVSYGQDTSPPQGTAAWVQLHLTQPGSITLPPHSSQVVDFSVTVPAGTGAGQWVMGIAAQQAKGHLQQLPSSSRSTKVAINVTTRSVVAIVVTVPGPQTYGIQLGQPSVQVEAGARQVLNLPMTSTGDMLMYPYLNTSLRRCSGGPTLLSLHRQLDAFVPRTSIQYPWYLQTPQHLQILPAGCYLVGVQVLRSAGGPQLADQTFRVTIRAAQASNVHPGKLFNPRPVIVHRSSGFPLWLLILLVVLALLVGIGANRVPVWVRRHRERQAGASQ